MATISTHSRPVLARLCTETRNSNRLEKQTSSYLRALEPYPGWSACRLLVHDGLPFRNRIREELLTNRPQSRTHGLPNWMVLGIL